MKKEYEDIITEYHAQYSRVFGNRTISYNNSIIANEPEARKLGPFALRNINHMELNIDNTDQLIEHFFKKSMYIEVDEEAKRNITDSVSMNKYRAIKEINKILDGRLESIGEFKNDRQKHMFVELVTAHELAHVYFDNKTNPTYDKAINMVGMNNLAHTPNNTIGSMRDELRSDTMAYLMLKKKYGNDNDFKEMMRHVADIRLLSSTYPIMYNTNQYNMYNLYKKDMDFLKKLPELNSHTVLEIEKKIDDITLKTVKAFGIRTNMKVEDPSRFMEENVMNTQKESDKNCDNGFNKILGYTKEQCMSDKTLTEEEIKALGAFRVPILNMDNEMISDAKMETSYKP